MINQVDVIFPTRNRLSDSLVTIQKLLDIGINQDQITIGDDASSEELLKTIRSQYPAITIYRNEKPIGQLATRNILFSITKRPFILSLDDDSHILSKADLEESLQILNNDKSAGIFGYQAHQDISEPPKKTVSSSQMEYVRTFIACGALLKRSCVNAIGKYTREELGYYCEEIDCSIRAFKQGFKVITKKDIWVHHRVDRNYKTMPKKSNISKGIYGSDWRSIMGFSDNLIVTGIYYPYFLDIAFSLLYIIKRFYGFTLKNKDFGAYFAGLRRTAKFSFYMIREKSPMSYSKFYQWIKLSMM